MENHLQLTAILVEDPQGGFTGYFAEIPEAIAEGETEAEVETNLFEALKIILDFRREESAASTIPDGCAPKTKKFNFEFA